MGRSNAEFEKGRWQLPYEGQALFHGSPNELKVGEIVHPQRSEPAKGIHVPVAWATTSHKDAKAQADRRANGGSTVFNEDANTGSTVYTVEPVNPEETYGTPAGRIYPGERDGINYHFISKHGFRVIGVHNGQKY